MAESISILSALTTSQMRKTTTMPVMMLGACVPFVIL